MQITFQKYSPDQRNLWEEINKSATSTFLTSIEWIDFQKALGKEVDQYLIYADNNPVGNLFVEISRRRIAKYAYSPYGPVVSSKEQVSLTEGKTSIKYLGEFLSSLKSFQEKYVVGKNLNLFRFDPLVDQKELNKFLELGFVQSLAPTQAKHVWEIDISKTEEELRSGMGKSTRYNINKTQREGLTLVKVQSDEEIKAFSDLMNETTNRKGFSNYDYKYFKTQFDALNPKGMCDIFMAKFEDKYLAGALVNYYKDTAYYTHGCSTSNRELSKLRAPYFLQWEVMKQSKEKGFQKYNMWGIVPIGHEKAADGLSGVSEFKRSFGGYEIDYVGALEVLASTMNAKVHRATDWWIYRKERY